MQTRQEWLLWRKGGLGSSDYAALMGTSPWGTPTTVYEDKITDDTSSDNGNFATQMGNKMEPKIRALYELHSGKSFNPKLLELQGFEWLRVSLDGADESIETIIEIKYCNQIDYNLSKNEGKVPEKYWPQVQGQLMVSGAKRCMYLAYPFTKKPPEVLEWSKMAIVEVLPDEDYQTKLYEVCWDFWFNNVKSLKPPKLSDADYKTLKGVAVTLVGKYRSLSKEINALEAERDIAKEELLALAKAKGHPRLKCDGMKLLQVSRIGNVDYKKVPELAGVDLEQYRKASSSYWKMEIEK